MTREEFINKLFTLYSNAFTKQNANLWFEEYESVLPEMLDYKKLDKIRATNYDKSMPPKPAWFIPYIAECRLKEVQKDELESVWVEIPWLGNNVYEFAVAKGTKPHEILKDLTQKKVGWRWNYTLNAPEKNNG